MAGHRDSRHRSAARDEDRQRVIIVFHQGLFSCAYPELSVRSVRKAHGVTLLCMTTADFPNPQVTDERRTELKTFLTVCRSRLKPQDVGLPVTGRRRVEGLRREEIAELVGVSTDWYRWFESGRPVRVSVLFLARLSDAFRLDPIERIALFCLALPELYEAYAAQQRLRSPLQLVGLATRC